MAPECQEKNLKALTMVAVGVNKSAEQYLLLDEETKDELARGKYHDQRRGSFGTSTLSSPASAASRAVAPAAPAPGAPARAASPGPPTPDQPARRAQPPRPQPAQSRPAPR